MMPHYLRFILRKQPLFTALNFGGLVVGMTAALLLFKYVRYEQYYDTQSPHYEYIWRVFNETTHIENGIIQDANTHSAIGPALKAAIPEVVDYARLYCGNSPEVILLSAQVPYEVSRCYMADPGFVRMFPPQFLVGDVTSCLSNPHTALITQSLARRLFGTDDARGRTFDLKEGMMAGQYTVSAVVVDPPQNTHLKFEVLLSYATRYAQGFEDNFSSYWDYNYVQITPTGNPEKLRKKLDEISELHLKENGIRLDIQPFKDIHLHSNLTYELEPNGSARTVYFLGLIGLLIMGIAFINFINLTTAIAHKRHKEIGIKKALGAKRSMLIQQFFLESISISMAALVVSAFCLGQFLPWFSVWIGRPLAVLGTDAFFWLISISIVMGMAFVSAVYPAFFMSGFRTAVVLQGPIKRGKTAWLRQGLVVVQFMGAIALVFGVVVVGLQLNFLKNHELGADIHQIISIKTPRQESRSDTMTAHQLGLFKTRCAQMAAIQGAASSSIVPGVGINGISGSSRPIHWTQSPDYKGITSYFINTDEDFFALFGIQVLAGTHRLLPDPAGRYQAVSINESMLNSLGFPSPESAIGQRIAYENSEQEASMTIMAVVKDFHIETLKTRPKPTLYYCFSPEQLQYLSLKVPLKNREIALAGLAQEWAKIYPNAPFKYWVLSAHFSQQYINETQLGQVFGLFGGLAILIACIGLLGLLAFQIQHRTKEIGIRKVLGASVSGITGLLAKDFLTLVLLSFVLASPIAWWLMGKWLEDFAYRIDMQWWMLAIAGVSALVIAFLTIGFQSVRAALANPVRSLRSE